MKQLKERGIDDGHIILLNRYHVHGRDYIIRNYLYHVVVCSLSVVGHRVGNKPDTHFYSATKHAITAITEGVRLELLQMNSNVKVTVSYANIDILLTIYYNYFPREYLQGWSVQSSEVDSQRQKTLKNQRSHTTRCARRLAFAHAAPSAGCNYYTVCIVHVCVCVLNHQPQDQA